MNDAQDMTSTHSQRAVVALRYGLGGIALSSLICSESAASAGKTLSHLPARAKRVIQIFLQGGLSQVDSFDYRPELINTTAVDAVRKESRRVLRAGRAAASATLAL